MELCRHLRFLVDDLINEKFIERGAQVLKDIASLQDLEMVEFSADLLHNIMLNMNLLGFGLDLEEEYLPRHLLLKVSQNQLLISYYLVILIGILEGLKVIFNLQINFVQIKCSLMLNVGAFIFVKDILCYIRCCYIL